MRLKSILNRVEPHAGFVYEHASFASSTDQPTIEIAIRPRRRRVCFRPKHHDA